MQRHSLAHMFNRALLVPVAVTCLMAASAAQTLDTETLLTNLRRPTWAGSPPGDERIFFTEQHSGIVRILDGQGGVHQFLDVGTVSQGNEQGLLGMAFHPKFEQNGYVFLNYTAGGDTIIERWTVSDGDPNVADPASRLEILRVDQPFSNHNAGDLNFGPLDGYLYIALGDGGSGNDPLCRAQNPGELLGKMLRIDVDDQDTGLNYAIPPDNPFVGVPGFREEIWALGLRNPFRFAFDSLTGDIYIGDVGQNSREEIDFEPAGTPGRNYGWPVMEADECKNANFNNCVNLLDDDPPACFDAEYIDPVSAYDLYVGGTLAVIGGEVYRGCKIPSLQGTYFHADYGSNDFFSFEIVGGVATNLVDRTSELATSNGTPSSFGVDGEGEILIVNLDTGNPTSASGTLARIVPASPPSIADCDGNGQDDACEIATYPWADMDGSGTVDACESFSADTDHVCIGVGGSQGWSLHAGASHGGEGYLVLGSFGGTSPGIDFGNGVVLPLNLDFYLPLTSQFANTIPFVNSLGTLDGSGNATASFTAPAGLLAPSVVGMTASHAYLTFTDALVLTSASNYTTLEFRP